jgi:capsule biosynthesis phosphatase
MNIIIPLGGLGVRFKDEQYHMPKPLIKVLGKELIFHLLDNLFFKPDDHVYMIIPRDLEKYGFSDAVYTKYPDVKILFLDKQTEGAVETVLLGLNQILDIKTKLQRRTVLLDCDNFYTTDILKMYRDLPEAAVPNAIVCFKDNQNSSIYSYLKFDDNKKITEIKEKVRISNYANTGCYCFSDILTLKNYCKKVIDENIRQKNEYYMSGLVQMMIEDNHPWIAITMNVEDYHCLGTPFQLKLYCNRNLLEADKKRICFDLDNTLVTSPTIKGDYSSVRPILKNIEYLRFLKKVGHTIIIYTARRMKTHNGNVGKVIQDIGKITINSLEKFNIPYDELIFGKPYADFYIDDLAVNSNFDLEKELGIYKTSIQERSFNELSSSKIEVITKRSQTMKIKGEIHWYKNIPIQLRDLFPALINYGNDYYTMEKINGIPLSYLFVNESLTIPLFTSFLESIHRIHSFVGPKDHDKASDNTEEFKDSKESKEFKESKASKESKESRESKASNDDNSLEAKTLDIYANYARKLEERYKSYDYKKLGPHTKVIYEKLLHELKQYEIKKEGKLGLIHGDPVFSNVMIDTHNNIKLIDMRGILGDVLTLEGDIFYDYAKIYQSLLGYDEILLGKMVSGRYKSSFINTFNEFITKLYGNDKLKKIAILSNSLIFTLVPLHDNEKCQAYLKLISLDM